MDAVETAAENANAEGGTAQDAEVNRNKDHCW